LLAGMALLLVGCPKGNRDFKAGKKAEAIGDVDTALIHYERALRADPRNIEYKLKATRLRFEAGQFHVAQGQKLRDKGEWQLALAEFQKAAAIDPSSAIAQQELQRTLELIAARQAPAGPAPPPPEKLMEKPPELAPLSREPINLKLTSESRTIFETIGKLAGVTVIFDPDFRSTRIATELTNVTLEQALDVVALQSKSFWRPVTSHIIFVIPDNPQKRKDYEEHVVRTFYLSNTVTPQDLTEIATGLRQVLQLTRMQQVSSQNAIVVRDTPDKLAVMDKILNDLDKAKPEVVVQVAVLQARRDRARDLGITPGASSLLSFTPRNPTGTGETQQNQIRLNQLQSLSSADYSITLPGATASFLLTDSTTKIIQNPEIRVVDGQTGKLRIGDKVPVALGSFQAGVGVGVGGAPGAGIVNPLVNTQFQYQDVGVNVDITPRVHSNREVSLKVKVEVSSVAGRQNIGGIEQPIFSQRTIDQDVRLAEGEVNILGGLFERSTVKTISGWPGFARIPILRYFFSGESVEEVENEVLIVLIPRVVRLPAITAENLRGLSSGPEQNIRVRPESAYQVSEGVPQTPQQAQPQPAPPAPPPETQAQPTARLRFEPGTITLKRGETAVVGLVVEDVHDLFSIPVLLQYNPAVVSVEEVRHAEGGFLSGGTQEIAIVQRIDAERGQAIISATRQPNTPGVSGTGTLLGIVLRGLSAGTTSLQIVQVTARDSQRNAIPMTARELQIRVE